MTTSCGVPRSRNGVCPLRLVVRAALGVSLLLAVAFVVAGRPCEAAAWSPADPVIVSHGVHRFWNYDFTAPVAVRDGCDWPVTIVFWGNASVAKVKQALASRLPLAGNEMYLLVTPDARRKRGSMEWSADRGIKTFSFTRALHLRLYADADGSLSGGDWGRFVLATTHLDLDELSANPTYGYSEQAAGEVEALCATAFGPDAVAPDCIDLRNTEPERTETAPSARGGVESHVWQCDGMATLVYVP